MSLAFNRLAIEIKHAQVNHGLKKMFVSKTKGGAVTQLGEPLIIHLPLILCAHGLSRFVHDVFDIL